MTHSNMPKQWKRWFKKAGLKSEYSSKLARNYGITYLKGHGRHWRLDDGGYLDMSEPFEQFDRWANSLESSVPMDAQNEKEFLKLVERLLPTLERALFMVRQRKLPRFQATVDAILKRALEHRRVFKREMFGRVTTAADLLNVIRSFPAERAPAPAQIGTICYDDSDLFHPMSGETRMHLLKERPMTPGQTLQVFIARDGVGRSLVDWDLATTDEITKQAQDLGIEGRVGR